MNAAELFGHWRNVRHDLLRALDMVSDDQLAFVPREGLWSLGRVARHIASAEDGWFRYVVAGELDGWPRFGAEDYATVASIQELLAQVHEHTEVYLATLDESDLDRMVSTPWGEDLSLRWIVWHVVEHEIHHRGEIYLMLGLMGMEAPDI
ncbi:DinB family protein [Chloroflexota bacterium]